MSPRTVEQPAEPAAPTLPVRAAELLERGAAGADALVLETRYGNADLYSLLDALGVVGPFAAESHW